MATHTCTTLRPGPCEACEALLSDWVMTQAEAVADTFAVRCTTDALTSARSGATLETVDMHDPSRLSDWESDPQRRWDDRDLMADALRSLPRSAYSGRLARIAERVAEAWERIESGEGDADALRSALRTVTGHGGEADREAHIRERLATPDGRHLRGLSARVRSAFESDAPEASVRPGTYGGGERWAVAKRPDVRTLAGPTVTVTADGATRVESVRYLDRLTCEACLSASNGADCGPEHDDAGRERVRVVEVTAVPLSPAKALTPEAVATVGTFYRPDRGTRQADAWVAAREPRGAVKRPSSRKRRRDGKVGTTMTTTGGNAR